MSKPLIDDELWNIIEALLPRPKRRRKKNPGRLPGVSDRAAMTGIIFVLRSGIPWKMLPLEMGCGSGSTCWRRLRAWHKSGVWKRLHQVLLSKLREAERIDFSRAVADSSSIRALGAGKKRDRTQPIAVVPARSTTFSLTRKAFRSRPF
jgi:transposase